MGLRTHTCPFSWLSRGVVKDILASHGPYRALLPSWIYTGTCSIEGHIHCCTYKGLWDINLLLWLVRVNPDSPCISWPRIQVTRMMACGYCLYQSEGEKLCVLWASWNALGMAWQWVVAAPSLPDGPRQGPPDVTFTCKCTCTAPSHNPSFSGVSTCHPHDYLGKPTIYTCE